MFAIALLGVSDNIECRERNIVKYATYCTLQYTTTINMSCEMNNYEYTHMMHGLFNITYYMYI